MLGRERIKQRLVLYQGVKPIYMQFSDDAEETFSRALKLLLVSDSSISLVSTLGKALHEINLFKYFPCFRIKVNWWKGSTLPLSKVEHNLSGVENLLITYKFARSSPNFVMITGFCLSSWTLFYLCLITSFVVPSVNLKNPNEFECLNDNFFLQRCWCGKNYSTDWIRLDAMKIPKV